MNKKLSSVINQISDQYREKITDVPGTRNYLEVNIGRQAGQMGFSDLMDKYHDVNAVVPLKQAVPGMKVRIDGRTFINYAQFASGVVVPGFVAKDTGLPYKTYVANDSMILNF